MSPPTGVYASPVATPTDATRFVTSLKKRGLLQILDEVLGLDARLVPRVLGDLARDLAEDRADLAFEVAHAGFARVVVDDRAQRRIADLRLRFAQPVGLALLLERGSAWRSAASRTRCSPRA